MYTSHGHHIPGTIKDDNPPDNVARCGGLLLCSVCQTEAVRFISQGIESKPIDVPEELDCLMIEQLTHEELVRVRAMELAIASASNIGNVSDFWLEKRAKFMEKYLKGES